MRKDVTIEIATIVCHEKGHYFYHWEISLLICTANQLTGFHMVWLLDLKVSRWQATIVQILIVDLRRNIKYASPLCVYLATVVWDSLKQKQTRPNQNDRETLNTRNGLLWSFYLLAIFSNTSGWSKIPQIFLEMLISSRVF